MSHSTAPLGKTRWRRFGVAAGVGFGVVAVLGYLAMSGALALSFVLSGIPFSLTADRLEGSGFVQYAYPDQIAGNPANLQKQAGDLIGSGPINNVFNAGANGVFASDTVSQFRSADIVNLSQTICAPTGALPVSIKVHLGGTGTTKATNLTIQAPALTAETATFNAIKIGESVKSALQDQGYAPGEFTDPNNGLSGPLGASFAQGANTATLTGIKQVGVGTEAGTFAIGGLTLWAEFVGNC